MTQPPVGQSDKHRSIAACLEAARQFEQTAGNLRGRFHAARGRPGGLTREVEHGDPDHIALLFDLWSHRFEPPRRCAPPLLIQGGEIPQLE